MRFVGRDRELAILAQAKEAKRSTLTVVHGRRRVGKTTLAERAFADMRFFKFEGLEAGSEARQKEHFVSQLYRYSGLDEHRVASTRSWTDLLILLSRFIGDTPCAVLFDEFQWMAAERATLVSELKYVWDNYFLKHNRCCLVLCGSVSSFVVKKVLRSRALYGRVDHEIDLKPFDLPTTIREFFGLADGRQILDYYLAAGGVPRYLELCDPARSARQNLTRYFFNRAGYLFQDLERLFVSHFGKVAHYRNIVDFLARRPNATKPEIERHCGLSSGGRVAELIQELVLADFIESYPSVHNPESHYLTRYRIKDPYLRFYFRFVAPVARRIKQQPDEVPIQQIVSEQRYRVWRGLAFEQCIREHSDLVARHLGFSAVRYDVGAFFKKQDQKSGFQVDLLFTRADDVVTLCEVKYAEAVGREVIAQVDQKAARIVEELKPYAVHKVLITVFPPAPAIVKSGCFDDILTFESLF
jgi:AAA+ ATPase superfamily predicted ATPase